MNEKLFAVYKLKAPGIWEYWPVDFSRVLFATREEGVKAAHAANMFLKEAFGKEFKFRVWKLYKDAETEYENERLVFSLAVKRNELGEHACHYNGVDEIAYYAVDHANKQIFNGVFSETTKDRIGQWSDHPRPGVIAMTKAEILKIPNLIEYPVLSCGWELF